MNPPPLSLRLATLADTATTLAWTPANEASLRRWAGPSTRFPATTHSLWEDISSADATTFVMESPAGEMLAFGQVKHREKTHGHLARLIVSPAQRGRGLGRTLCLLLMREAIRLHPDIKGYSLYVHTDNLNAYGLYRSLGFVDRGLHPEFPCMLMEAPLSAAAESDRRQSPWSAGR